MKIVHGVCTVVLMAAVVITSAGGSYAETQTDLSRAKDTVNKIRLADPPSVSTSTVTRSTDTATSIADRENQKERGRDKERAQKYNIDKIEVPAPGSSDKRTREGQTDPTVRKGWDDYQQQRNAK